MNTYENSASIEKKSLPETISHLGQLIISIPDHGKFLRDAVRVIESWVPCSYVSVLLFNEQRDRLVMQATCGEHLADRDCYIPTDIENSIAVLVCETGDTYLSDDLNTESRIPLTEVLPGMRSKLVLPLRTRKEIIGVLDIQSHRPGVFGREDQTMLLTLANQISIIIHGSGLYRQTQKELEKCRQGKAKLQKAYNELEIQVRRETAEHLKIIELFRREITDRRRTWQELAEYRQDEAELQKAYNDLEKKIRKQTTDHLKTTEFLRREIIGFRQAGQELKKNRQDEAELQKAYNDLEMRVRRRTAEHLRTIELFRREIIRRRRTQEDLVRLETEMKVARQLQQMILPATEELVNIKELKLASFMDPAEEVGGDYYDVVSASNHDWIVIGDVAGHGVTAGLIAMMVQVAIHTVIQGNPEVTPDSLLSAVNNSLHGSMKRLDETKHMTIVVITAGKDGNFTFSGMHDEILIWRKDTGKVDVVDISNALWIGLEPDISELVSTDTFRLEPGDCMLLYTDGVTEANDENDKMFGDEHLIKILEESGSKSAFEVQKNIIDALEPWEKPDDVTFIVVKRKK